MKAVYLQRICRCGWYHFEILGWKQENEGVHTKTLMKNGCEVGAARLSGFRRMLFCGFPSTPDGILKLLRERNLLKTYAGEVQILKTIRLISSIVNFRQSSGLLTAFFSPLVGDLSKCQLLKCFFANNDR